MTIEAFQLQNVSMYSQTNKAKSSLLTRRRGVLQIIQSEIAAALVPTPHILQWQPKLFNFFNKQYWVPCPIYCKNNHQDTKWISLIRAPHTIPIWYYGSSNKCHTIGENDQPCKEQWSIFKSSSHFTLCAFIYLPHTSLAPSSSSISSSLVSFVQPVTNMHHSFSPSLYHLTGKP